MNPIETDEKEDKLNLKIWLFVLGLAAWLLLYGIFVFMAVGDKGPPDWDFGVIPDTPGQSVYSTSPEPGGDSGQPEAQHVAGKPSQVPSTMGGGQE
jgi:hypothetical protein